MYFSDLRPEDVDKLTNEQVYDIMMDGVFDLADSKSHSQNLRADFLVVLGASPVPLKARIIKALELFKQEKGENILFSGGTGWHRLYTFDENIKYRTLDELTKARFNKAKKYNEIKITLGKMIPDAIKPSPSRNLKGKAKCP